MVKNLKEKLITADLKFRQFKENTKKMLKSEKGSAITYVLMIAIGLILLAVTMWPVLRTLTEDLVTRLREWWTNQQTNIFDTTTP